MLMAVVGLALGMLLAGYEVGHAEPLIQAEADLLQSQCTKLSSSRCIAAGLELKKRP